MKGKGLIIVVVVVLLVAALFGTTYNKLVGLREEVSSKAADIDTYLQRRADLIPNLVETVKGYMKHEKAAIDSVTNARAALVGAKTIEEKAKANDDLSSAISRLLVIAENYPKLEANTTFIQLQDELAGSENRIATARKDYNDAVKAYNGSVKKFPSNIIAGMFNFEESAYFEAKETAKDVPEVNFD